MYDLNLLPIAVGYDPLAEGIYRAKGEDLSGKVELGYDLKSFPIAVGYGALADIWKDIYRAKGDALPVSSLLVFRPNLCQTYPSTHC